LELGALASRAEVTEGDSVERDYLLAGADLNVSSPLVAGLSDGLDEAVGEVSDGVNDLLGPDGDIQGTLDDLSIDPITVPGLLTVDVGGPELNVEVNLGEVTDGLLNKPLVSDNGLVTIDFNSGLINVDLAQLHGGDLNGLEPNTELLTSDEITQITDTVAELLGEVTGLVTDAVHEALLSTEFTLTIDPELEGIGGAVSGDIDIALNGTLAQFLGQDGEEAPEVDVSGSVTVGVI